MIPRFSPPPQSHKQASRLASRSIFFRQSRYTYLAISVVLLYLLVKGDSPLFFLPYRAHRHSTPLHYSNVNWSRYAYFQYATSTAYLCNSVMIFEALNRLGSKADRILMYPAQWDTQIESQSDRDSQLLVKARDWYNVRLVPVNIPVTDDKDAQDDQHEESFIKFAAWNTARYERVLYLASDTTILKPVDELFLLPSTPVAMMREHWILPVKKALTSRLILLQPSDDEFERLSTSLRPDIRQNGDNVTQILNRFYGDTAMILPHQAYGLLSSEFRIDDHRNYIGNTYDLWDPEKAFREASLLHFIDEPFPKPWVMWHHLLLAEKHPQCKEEDCRNKDVWMSLYDDFRKRRKVSLRFRKCESSSLTS
ncbi:MAG: hypothetical protein Q9223_001400 [Gallowayella weberi]